jgi:hypothetical protein
VATVIQKVGSDGQLTIQVEPPGPEHESDLANATSQHHLGECRLVYSNCRNGGTKLLPHDQFNLHKVIIIQYFSYLVHFTVCGYFLSISVLLAHRWSELLCGLKLNDTWRKFHRNFYILFSYVNVLYKIHFSLT